jgi:hypothetical protein
VLLPLLWSLVVNDLFWELTSDGYYTVGYADESMGNYFRQYQRFYEHYEQFNNGVTKQIYPSTPTRR